MKRCKLTVKEQQHKVWKRSKGEKQRTRGTEVTIKKIEGALKTDETGEKKALFLKQSCSEVIVQSNQEKSL